MKLRIGLHRIVFALTVITTIAASSIMAGEETNSPATIPLIVMDQVPLNDAIRNLARQAGMNFILDPRLPGNSFGANGKWTPPPNVSVRWENITAREALDRVLKEHDLVLVDNPATGVARIAPKAVNAKPVPSTAVDTNSPVIPLIVMSDMPLDEAIKHLAQSAKLDVVLDPKVSNPMAADGRPMPQPTVSIRWEDITGRQALAAVLDNYDLVMREGSPGGAYWITNKPKHLRSKANTATGDLLERLVTQLQISNQTNALDLFNQLEAAEDAQQASANLSLQLRCLDNLREGRTIESIKLLESQMAVNVVMLGAFYSDLSTAQKDYETLDMLKRAREYCDKYKIKGGSDKLDHEMTNAFRLVDAAKKK